MGLLKNTKARPLKAQEYTLWFDHPEQPLLSYPGRGCVEHSRRINLTLEQYRMAKRVAVCRGDNFVDAREKSLEALDDVFAKMGNQKIENRNFYDVLVAKNLYGIDTPFVIATKNVTSSASQTEFFVNYQDFSTPYRGYFMLVGSMWSLELGKTPQGHEVVRGLNRASVVVGDASSPVYKIYPLDIWGHAVRKGPGNRHNRLFARRACGRQNRA